LNTEYRSYGARRWIVQLAALFALLLSAPAVAQQERFVLAFGDSLTAGYRLKPAESFAAQLESVMRINGFPMWVHNAGVSGDTTAAGRARLDWTLRGLKRKPDLVILQLGGNDMLRGLSPAQTRANLDAMLAEFGKRGIPVILAGMRAPPNMGRDYQRQFDAIYPALAKKHGARLYPFFLEGIITNRSLLLPDGIHPNAAGTRIMARRVGPLVRDMLFR
jgi:acyl-CoA thioesterase-1